MTDLHMSALPSASELTVTPTLDEVRELSARGGQVALTHSWIADCETPVAAFLKLRDGGPAFLLESAEHGRLGRYSMIGVRPQAIVRGRGTELVHTTADGVASILDGGDPFAAVQDVVEAVGMLPSAGPALPFAGGAVGFFGYDLVRQVEPIGPGPTDDLGLPDLMVMITGPVVVFDHLQHTLTVSVPCELSHSEDPEPAYQAAVATIAELRSTLVGPLVSGPTREDAAPPHLGEVTSNTTRAAFHAAVERCREYIVAGDAFQIVPSQRFSAEVDLDPFAIYRGLRAVNPSPYMFFVEFDEYALVGSSPETLVKVEGRTVHTRPIAGTRPRGASEEQDRQFAEDLLADPKERAEHVMLVDLGRNDLGRVCQIGSVRVEELMGVHRYSHVMHIESSVVGELAIGRRACDALRVDVPGGNALGRPEGSRHADHRRA